MAVDYYECHITFIGQDRTTIEQTVRNCGWKFSAIDGDPTLGNKVFEYATKHYPKTKKLEEIILEMDAVANKLAENSAVLRQKIELIVYDTKK